jgi:hypothetical protein
LALPAPGEATWRTTVMPQFSARRPLKRWRYVGVYAADLMLCIGDVHVGPAHQTFWAVWDPERGLLVERTHVLRHGSVQLEPGRARVTDSHAGIEIDVSLDEDEGITTVCPNGSGYVWTRKQAGVQARGSVTIVGAPPRSIDARGVVDDTAGYHARETAWRWCAGIGVATTGEQLAWNLVSGVNDPPTGSERTLWIDGNGHEVDAVSFADDLGAVRFDDGTEVRFDAQATRHRRENLLVVRSEYEQPFGSFSGALPGGLILREGYGVMERHAARW